MTTRRAPALRWPDAAAREVKRPVASSTTSTSLHGISAGCGERVQRIVRPPATRAPSCACTTTSRRPARESWRRRCARIPGSARSLTATTWRSSRSRARRRNPRPMRPSPLMPMRITTFSVRGTAAAVRPAGETSVYPRTRTGSQVGRRLDGIAGTVYDFVIHRTLSRIHSRTVERLRGCGGAVIKEPLMTLGCAALLAVAAACAATGECPTRCATRGAPKCVSRTGG